MIGQRGCARKERRSPLDLAAVYDPSGALLSQLSNLLRLLRLLRLQFTPLTVYSVCDSELLRCQSSKRAKLYVPKSRNLADLPAVKLIKLINRQLS